MGQVPDPIDVHVGRRVRATRNERMMSQQSLAGQLDLTFQQIQKYEKGTNRISASRLWKISRILRVPVGYFFEGLDPEDETVIAPAPVGRRAAHSARRLDALDPRHANPIHELIRILAGEAPEAAP